MKPLPYTKHELFAHIVASGNPPEVAYVGIDKVGEPGEARALAKVKRIAARIEYLRGQYSG